VGEKYKTPVKGVNKKKLGGSQKKREQETFFTETPEKTLSLEKNLNPK